MRHEMTIDQRIRTPPDKNSRTLEEWSAIASHLVRTFSAYLQQEVVSTVSSVGEGVIDGEALCWSIRSSTVADPLAIMWIGTIGMDVITGQVDVSASLFLFSRGKRLSVAGQQGSYLEFAYEFDSDDVGHWRCLGWLEDLYGEYTAFDQLPEDV